MLNHSEHFHQKGIGSDPEKLGPSWKTKKSDLSLTCSAIYSGHVTIYRWEREGGEGKSEKVVWGLELHSNYLQFGCATSSIDDTSYIAMVLLKIAGNEGGFVRWHQGSKTLEQNHIKDQS